CKRLLIYKQWLWKACLKKLMRGTLFILWQTQCIFSRWQYLMSLDMSVEVLPKYVQIELLGVYTFSDLMQQVDRFRAEADNAGRNQILIDARSVEGKMTESERFL